MCSFRIFDAFSFFFFFFLLDKGKLFSLFLGNFILVITKDYWAHVDSLTPAHPPARVSKMLFGINIP